MMQPEQSPIGIVPQRSVGMWDAFEHVLMFISMCVFASSSAMLMHTFVDTWIPATNSNPIYNTYSDFSNTFAIGYLSAIIVSFPIFAFLFLRVTKRTKLDPAIRSLMLRKILIYLTLTVTFVILISKLISVVFTLLSGNIGMNFLLHFLITVSVSGLIFIYYFLQVKEDRQPLAVQ